MRAAITIGITAAAVAAGSLVVFGALSNTAPAQKPTASESQPLDSASGKPTPTFVFEGDVEAQLRQSVRALTELGYPTVISNLRDGSAVEVSTLAPQETVDAVFENIDVEYVLVHTEIVGQ